MKHTKIQLITAHTMLLAAGLFPLISFAHGDEDDGHIEEVVQNTTAGASFLLKAFSPAWWGLLVVSVTLTSLLSYAVWRYLQVPDEKKEEKK